MVEELKKKFKELQDSFNALFEQKPKNEELGTDIIKKQEPFFEKLTKFSENIALGFENMQKKYNEDYNKMKISFQDTQKKWDEKIKELEKNQQEKKDEWKKSFEEWKKQNQENLKEGLNFWNKTGWRLYIQMLLGTIPVIIILIIIFNLLNMFF
ncbi:MAG: hypothetical protein EAX96_01050 [Candidatus Lokiarchaeota archaeon]|nr:hypothetical protein [Candidatus Lokiarchaeota archaeon]